MGYIDEGLDALCRMLALIKGKRILVSTIYYLKMRSDIKPNLFRELELVDDIYPLHCRQLPNARISEMLRGKHRNGITPILKSRIDLHTEVPSVP